MKKKFFLFLLVCLNLSSICGKAQENKLCEFGMIPISLIRHDEKNFYINDSDIWTLWWCGNCNMWVRQDYCPGCDNPSPDVMP